MLLVETHQEQYYCNPSMPYHQMPIVKHPRKSSMHAKKPASAPCMKKWTSIRESTDSDANKIITAAYARTRSINLIIIFSMIHSHLSQPKIKMSTNSLLAHGSSACQAAQNCFAALAFGLVPSPLADMASRIPLSNIALYTRRRCWEAHAPTALNRHAIPMKKVETKRYQKRALMAMPLIKSMQ